MQHADDKNNEDPQSVSGDLYPDYQTRAGSVCAPDPEAHYQADLVAMRGLRKHRVLVNDLEQIRQMLLERPQDYGRERNFAHVFGDLFERYAADAGPSQHARIRPILELALGLKNMRAALPIIGQVACDTLDSQQDPKGVIDLFALTDQYAQRVTLKLLLSLEADHPDGQALLEQVPRLRSKLDRESAGAVFGGGGFERTRADAANFKDRLQRILEERQTQIEAFTAPDDLATRLLSTPHPEWHERLDAAFIAEQIAGLLIHGSATISSACAWTLWLLAQDPALQARAQEEANALMSSGTFDFMTLAKRNFLSNALREGQRLFPPVPIYMRRAREAELIGETQIRNGAACFISPWHLGRHAGHWADPQRFDPDRWNGDGVSAPDLVQNIPFSDGPRRCPGAGLARLELLVFLAHFLCRFQLSPTGNLPCPQAGISLRAESGLPIRLAPQS